MKAILILDEMPTSCSMCKADKICKVWNEEQIKFKGYNDRLDDCPLKPMPDEACEKLVQGLDAMEKMKAVEVKVVRRTE